MNTMRPDEQAEQSRISANNKRDVNIKRGAKAAATAAIGTAGAGLIGKLTPFLSDLIPVDLAMKGIGKISPKLGEFLQAGSKRGLNVKDGIDFIKQNFSRQEKEENQPAQEDRNIIEQYSPELFNFIKEKIQSGKSSPTGAGIIAYANPAFKAVIDKIEKDHKVGFSQITDSIFGGGQMAQKQQRQAPQPQSGQQGGQSVSPGMQSLMDAINRLQQTRGGGVSQ
jgi:hypothetical protein